MKITKSPFFTGTLLLAGLGSLLLSSGGSTAAPGASVGKSLQGVWQGARFDSGKGEDPSKGVKLQLTIKGNHVSAMRLPEGNIGEGDFRLSADGSTIDAIGTTGGYKGKNFLGTLKIQGDTLYWCTTSGKPSGRPTDFVAGNGNYLIVVKRQQ